VRAGDGAIGPSHIAVLPSSDISDPDAQFVDAMHDQLIISLGQAGGLTVAPRSAMLIYQDPAPADERVGRATSRSAPLLEGTVFRTGTGCGSNVAG